MNLEPIAYGIDLGTTNSCLAAYFKDAPKNPQVLDNPDSEYITPSVVSFLDKQILVGKHALNKRAENPENTVYCVKRLIGRKCDDPHLIRDRTNFTYNVEGNRGELPKIRINTERYKDLSLFPEQISAMVLSYLKQVRLPTKTRKVVITVPANFNDYQRRATMDAAKIADLDPICVISEPTAACIAHAYTKGYTQSKYTVLVYDFGGGTLDVSLVEIQGGNFTVIATAGDAHCGGQDIDQKIFDMCIERMKAEGWPDLMKPTTPEQNDKFRRSRAQLLNLCEEAKRSLSIVPKCEIFLPEVEGDKGFKTTFTRGDIDTIIDEMKDKLINPIDIVLNQSEKDIKDINDIVLVGGSSRIPHVQELITEKTKKSTYSPVNQDEAIAFGAAIYGAFREKAQIKGFTSLTITDVTPMAISIGLYEDNVRAFLERNTPRPAISEWIPLRPMSEDAEEVTLTLFEGDEKKKSKCYRVGEFQIQVPKGLVNMDQRIFARAEVNDDGIVMLATVSKDAPKDTSEIKNRLVIKNDKPVHSSDGITTLKNTNIEMLKDERHDDINYRAIAISNCNTVKAAKNRMTKDSKIKKEADNIIAEVKGAISGKEGKEGKEVKAMTKDEFKKAMDDLESKITALIPSYSRPEKFVYYD